MRTLRGALLLLVVAAAGCASAPPAPAPGRATLFGTLKLTPRQGLALPAGGPDAGYGDPRLRDVALVDYSRPGFAVVYLDGGASPAGTAVVSIRSSVVSSRLEPARVAVGVGGWLRVANASDQPHVVSLPGSDVVRSLAPGEQLEVALTSAGAHSVFLLDGDAESVVFAAPGPFAVVGTDGAWQLRDLPPGPARVRAWHPRFPGAEQSVELAADEQARVDLELGVDSIGGDDHAAP